MRGIPSLQTLCLRSVGGKNCNAEEAFAPGKDGAPSTASRLLRSFSQVGIIVGLLFLSASLTPSLLPRVPGLDDALFHHDGTMTKQEVRAATLAKLMPMRGALLWDIGTGCGSVAVEWMRAARYARAIGIEPRGDRRAMAAENALALGAPRLELIDGAAPEALKGLEAPDAVFVGGGMTEETFDAAWNALRPLGRCVANAVTLESETQLMALHQRHGGQLVKLQVHRAEPIGGLTGWRPAMPVTQWSLVKR